MTTLVIGSVVIYSFYLPQTAPKQITLAVLPFTENEEFTPLSVGFSTVLRDSIALSRDVVVVDSVSTYAVMWDREKASEAANILAITHFVDGELHRSGDELQRIDFRVINVSQPNWKEVHISHLALQNEMSHPLQDARDELTRQVRTALYDNSFLRTESNSYEPLRYRAFCEELGDWFLEFKDDNRLSELHEQYRLKSRALYEKHAIASEPSQLVWDAIKKFQSDQNLPGYSETLWQVSGDFPNGPAVNALAYLAYDLGKFDLAEALWLRVARAQPQSSIAALNIANARKLLGDDEGVEQAIRIAKLRDDLGLVGTYKLDNDNPNELESSLTPDELRDLFTFKPLAQHAQGGDLLIETLIAQDALGAASTTIDTARLWREPPMFIEKNDARWLHAKEYLERFYPTANVTDIDGVLSRADNELAIEQLFAPRRPD